MSTPAAASRSSPASNAASRDTLCALPHPATGVADPLDRPTQGIKAAGTALSNQVNFTYDDTAKTITSEGDLTSSGDKALKGRAFYDGLGRTYRKASYEGSTWSIVETQFDVLGRVSQVSNPYRATDPATATAPANTWTTTTYDALGRVLTITTPDGAVVATAYSGNRVLVMDQAGKQRLSETDALGHLKNVWEIRATDAATVPVSFPNHTEVTAGYLTSYQYDTLDNLTTVTQGSQTRTFVYDSLKRLTAATNPESGAISYTYDANSNLLTKTDANSLTTTYTYDALNRNIYVRYSSYPNGTSGVDLVYDTATNGKGKLNYTVSYNTRWDGDNRGYWHADVTDNYDALGRPTSRWQGFALSNAQNVVTGWQPYNLSQTYNLAGGVTSTTYPSGKTVNYSYDSVGRLSTFNGNLGDGVLRSYASGMTYTAAGQITHEAYGLQSPLYLNLHYNNRLQMVDLRLGDSPTDEWNWTRGALIFYYGANARNNWNPFADSPDNNGNLLRQVNYAPLTAGGYVIPQLDDYSYDALNRNTSVSEIQQNSSGVWSGNIFTQTFSYDRWGNRAIDINNTTLNVPGVTRKSLTISTANNRLTAIDGAAVSYDPVGNQTNDGTYARVYEGENRISKANGSNGANYYYYDANGRRARRVVGGVETWQVYGFGGELVAEYNVSGTFNGANAPVATAPTKEYGYRSGKLLVVWDSGQTGNAAFRWLVTDHLGSTRMEADLSGSLATMRRHDYLPFGEELLATTGAQRSGIGYELPPSNVRQKFTGKERDTETGLDFFEARYLKTVQIKVVYFQRLCGSGLRRYFVIAN